MTTSPSTADRAQEAAGTAAEQGKHVAGTAKQEAQTVASEAAGQAKSVVNDALGQVSDQSKAQKDRLAGTLTTFGDDLESMASNGGPGIATDVARQVASQVRTIATHLESREPNELLDDVRRFARQRPGTFLLGALAAGVVAGRVLRGTADGIAAATAAPSAGTGLDTGVPAGSSGYAGMSGTAAYAGTTDTSTYGSTGGGLTGEEETYVPSPSTETGGLHGQPTMDTPTSAPMARPEAGYGERGVLGDEGGLR